jgi:NADPH-dependent 2,4-dienoyl-CoA reductase/sulfur reductase-like enzyme
LDEGVRLASLINDTGHADFLNVSGWPGIGSIGSPFGFMVPAATAIKAAVGNLPVMAIGRVVQPAHAEEILTTGNVDLVGMTRASIADPFLPAKARAGHVADIRVCIGAGQGCLMRNANGQPLTCQQNPTVGREAEWSYESLPPAPTSRRVLVVGGGPAGLEAATVAAMRGHAVTLLDSGARPGGQVNYITRVERRREFERVVEWRVSQLAKLGVEVQLGTTATRATLAEFARAAPDGMILLATGSTPFAQGWYPARPDLPMLPGADQPHVFTIWQALDGAVDDCRHVAVIDGRGYYQSSDVVEYLSQQRIRTSAICSTAAFAEGIERNDRPSFAAAARQNRVEFHPYCVVEAITERTVRMVDTLTGEERTVDDVDAVVVSLGSSPNDDLLRGSMQERLGIDVIAIGDCVAARGIEHAIFEGHRAGRRI